MKLLRGRIKDLLVAGLSGYGYGYGYGSGSGSGSGFIKTDKDRNIITKTEVIEVIED